jgi:L-2-hydroxyglutarate oxidase LhgO
MPWEKEKIDVAIVGGGIVGLWCAYSLLKKNPDRTVVVFEAEPYLGEHTSSRNSEVLHSGIYYPTGSLKHLHCVRGNELWREYVKEKGMPFLDAGKVVCAVKGQEEKLESLFQQGRKNDVPRMRKLSKSEISAYKDILNIDDGFFCETSGVLNVAEALGHLWRDIESMGGMVLVKNCVKLKSFGDGEFVLDVNGDEIYAETLVNCAGLFAVEFRKALGLTDYENFYVRGSYLKLTRKMNADKLIYPIPPEHGLGLGVHLTLDTDGGQKFGPDTEPVERIDYALEESLKEKMLPSIHEIFKNVHGEDLQLGYAGIRPKVKKNGKLVTDFVLNTSREHKIPGYYEFLGIESPGITASPSLAQMLNEVI